MNNNIATLLTDVYEIEGLLLVVSRHGNDTPPLVYERIKKAAHNLNEQCKMLNVEAPAMATEPATQPAPEPQATPEPEKVPVEDREPDEDIDFEFVYEDDEPSQAEETPVPVAEERPVEEPKAAPSAEDDGVEPSQQDDDDMPVSPFSFTADADNAGNRNSMAHEVAARVLSDEEDDFIVSTPSQQTPPPMKSQLIDDTPAPHRQIQNLRSLFSINDYYRFRRELFEGDDNAMEQALYIINETSTFDEVEKYFYNDLDWERDNQDVADFLDTVRNHFK